MGWDQHYPLGTPDDGQGFELRLDVKEVDNLLGQIEFLKQ